MCKCAPAGHEVHPSSQSKSEFLGQFLLGGLDLEAYLDGLWGRRLKNKKGRQLFWQEKVHPRQNPGYAYGLAGAVSAASICLSLYSESTKWCTTLTSTQNLTDCQTRPPQPRSVNMNAANLPTDWLIE